MRDANFFFFGRHTRSAQRRDKLVQHLKRFHGVKVVRDDVLCAWEQVNKVRNWQCGFCGKMLTNWDKRALHISKHFRDGCGMGDWKSAEYWTLKEVTGGAKSLLGNLKGLVKEDGGTVEG